MYQNFPQKATNGTLILHNSSLPKLRLSSPLHIEAVGRLAPGESIEEECVTVTCCEEKWAHSQIQGEIAKIGCVLEKTA